jgi:CubicO group peptidase (beta-lactamase class C family)
MDSAVATALEALPATRTVYSDVGAIVLTRLLETRYGMRIDRLLEQRLFGPLGMAGTRFQPPPGLRQDIAPTEQDPWRGRMVHGEVHDENAAWLDGVSGHAGLFAPAGDLLRFGEWLLDQAHGRRTAGCPATCPSLRQATMTAFLARQGLVPGATRALGWDTPSATGSSAGDRLAPASVGHTGFTGTSIWIDPTRDLVVVLLANRVHPTRENARFGPLRGVTANRAMEVLEGPRPHPGIR